MIKTYQKLIKLGPSLVVTIPFSFIKVNNLKVGDYVKISVEVVEKKGEKILTLECPHCHNFFNDTEQDIYNCPVCGVEIHDVDIINRNGD